MAGLTLYRLLTHVLPFGGKAALKGDFGVPENASDDDYIGAPDGCGQCASTLLHRLLRAKPQDRISAADAVTLIQELTDGAAQSPSMTEFPSMAQLPSMGQMCLSPTNNSCGENSREGQAVSSPISANPYLPPSPGSPPAPPAMAPSPSQRMLPPPPMSPGYRPSTRPAAARPPKEPVVIMNSVITYVDQEPVPKPAGRVLRM